MREGIQYVACQVHLLFNLTLLLVGHRTQVLFLEERLRQAAQVVEDRSLLLGQLARDPVHDTQRTDRHPADERRSSGLESNIGYPGDQWVIEETLILLCVPDFHDIPAQDGVRTKCPIARGLRHGVWQARRT